MGQQWWARDFEQFELSKERAGTCVPNDKIRATSSPLHRPGSRRLSGDGILSNGRYSHRAPVTKPRFRRFHSTPLDRPLFPSPPAAALSTKTLFEVRSRAVRLDYTPSRATFSATSRPSACHASGLRTRRTWRGTPLVSELSCTRSKICLAKMARSPEKWR